MKKTIHGYKTQIILLVNEGETDEGRVYRSIDYVNTNCVDHIVEDIIAFKDIELIQKAVAAKNQQMKDNVLLDHFTLTLETGLPKVPKNKMVFRFYFKKDVLDEIVRGFSFDAVDNVLKTRVAQLNLDI